MSAPNQLQQNLSEFYNSQYMEFPITFTAVEPNVADSFNSILRIRKFGRMVSVELIMTVAGTGTTVNVRHYDSTTILIPVGFRPPVAKYGAIMFSNTNAVYNQAGFILINSSGTISLYPASMDFAAGSYIQNAIFTYYI